MQLGRHQLYSSTHPAIASVDFADGDQLFSVTHAEGYSIWKTNPVRCLRQRSLKGTLERVLIIPESPLLALQGGGTSPLYPPNKVIIQHDGLDVPLAELEFGEKVRNIKSRPGALIVILSRTTLWYDYGIDKDHEGEADGTFWIERRIAWQTEGNHKGLIALSWHESETTLALSGRQPGHCQIVAVTTQPDAPGHPSRHRTVTFRAAALRVPIIIAHTHELAAIAIDARGEHLVTASTRGTLLRLWDVQQGHMLRELRRGADQADIWGVRFRGLDAGGRADQLVCWSDKGTVHVWPVQQGQERLRARAPRSSSSASLVKRGGKAMAKLVKANVPLPNYFSAEASHQQFNLPTAAQRNANDVSTGRDEVWHERFILSWLPPGSNMYGQSSKEQEDTQMVLITHTGGWYRLRFPISSRTVADEQAEEEDADCTVVEHRSLWRLSEQ